MELVADGEDERLRGIALGNGRCSSLTGDWSSPKSRNCGADTLASLGASTVRDSDAALRAYDRARRTEFRGKWIVEKAINAAVCFAPAINYFARTLEARKDMADLLVGVTGDFVPAAEVLRPSYLFNLLWQSSRPPAPGA